MKDDVNNKIINSIFLILGGVGLIWLLLQDDFIFIYIHPITVISFILFIVGIIRLIIQTKKYGINQLWYEIVLLSIVSFSLVGVKLSQTEIFKSDIILEARLVDDLTGINLILRKNGTFETISYTIYGDETIQGEYALAGDTIVFIDRPYDNDFIPQNILIDNNRWRIWIKRGVYNRFDTTEYFAGYFEIVQIDSLLF